MTDIFLPSWVDDEALARANQGMGGVRYRRYSDGAAAAVADSPQKEDAGLVLYPDEWGEFEHPERGKMPIVCVTSPELERMVKDGTLEVAFGGIETGNDVVGPALHFRLPQFRVYIPLGSAPPWWLLRAQRRGFAVAFPEQETGERAWFAISPFRDLGLYLPGDRREKVGRNDPCPCGSGVKFKRCCGA